MAKTAGDNETLVELTVRVPRELLERIDAIAHGVGKPRSAHLRNVLTSMYSKPEESV